MHWRAPGLHMPPHEPMPLAAVTHTFAHICASSQVPIDVQSCCVEPLHRVVVGEHAPRHAATPPVVSHTPGHGIVTHAPFASQSWMLLPMHLVWLGLQTPTHPVGLQTEGHVAVVTQAPPVQVWSRLPAHCVLLAVHAVQVPWLHIVVTGHGAPLFDQVLFMSQDCG